MVKTFLKEQGKLSHLMGTKPTQNDFAFVNGTGKIP